MKCNFKAFGQASDRMIQEFEQYIGFSLPDDYKEFLRTCNGGIINTVSYQNYVYYHPERGYWSIWVKELNEYIAVDTLYGINLKENDIREVNDKYGDELPDKSIYIGDAKPYGYIYMNFGDIPGVYYYETSDVFERPDDDVNTYKIANTFTEFIDGLVEAPLEED